MPTPFIDEIRNDVVLIRLVRRYTPSPDFKTNCDWIFPTGGTLVARRSLVCYDFVCHDMPVALPSDSHRLYTFLA